MGTEHVEQERVLAHIHLGEDGGAERFFVRLAGGLARRGVRQIAFVRPGRAWKADLQEHCEVREVRFSRSHVKRHVIRYRIAQEIRRFGASATLGWMSPASKWTPGPGPAMRTFIRLGDFPDTFRTYGKVQHLIGNTPEIVRQAVEMGWPSGHAHMISNFVDHAGEAPPINRAEANTPESATVAVALGRFVGRKRFDLLVRAVTNLPDIHVWLIGDGPLKVELQQLAQQCGVADRVHFLGWIRDPSGHLAAANILACPSDEEPLGNVILEGWHAGLPVIATASEGPSWLIEQGKTGLLSPCGDAEGLAASLGELLDNPDLRKQLSAHGKKRLVEQFSEGAICDAYLKLLFE